MDTLSLVEPLLFSLCLTFLPRSTFEGKKCAPVGTVFHLRVDLTVSSLRVENRKSQYVFHIELNGESAMFTWCTQTPQTDV